MKKRIDAKTLTLTLVIGILLGIVISWVFFGKSADVQPLDYLFQLMIEALKSGNTTAFIFMFSLATLAFIMLYTLNFMKKMYQHEMDRMAKEKSKYQQLVMKEFKRISTSKKTTKR